MIFVQYAKSEWPWFLNATTYLIMKFGQIMHYICMLKVGKFQECACTRLYSVKENIEGDVNLHQFPRNRVKIVPQYGLVIWLTLELKFILTFCKKPLFCLIEIFQRSSTLISWPGLPIALKNYKMNVSFCQKIWIIYDKGWHEIVGAAKALSERQMYLLFSSVTFNIDN